MTDEEKQVTEIEKKQEKLTSILVDPENFNIKHPLNSYWTIWYDCPQRKTTQQSWSLNIKKIASFNTIEDFWGTYNSIPPITKLAQASNYHIFRNDIKPEWEDPQNAEGGRWVVTLGKNPNPQSSKLEEIWLNILLACIGESFEYPDQINGAVASYRTRGDRLALWTRNHVKEEETMSVGKHFKSLFPKAEKLQFFTHEEGKTKNSPKEKYSL